MSHIRERTGAVLPTHFYAFSQFRYPFLSIFPVLYHLRSTADEAALRWQPDPVRIRDGAEDRNLPKAQKSPHNPTPPPIAPMSPGPIACPVREEPGTLEGASQICPPHRSAPPMALAMAPAQRLPLRPGGPLESGARCAWSCAACTGHRMGGCETGSPPGLSGMQ